MFVLLNGAFEIGKTTVADLLARSTPERSSATPSELDMFYVGSLHGCSAWPNNHQTIKT